MLICTIKLRRGPVALALAALILSGALILTLLLPQRTVAAALVSPKGITTAADRANYLRQWGWEVPDQCLEVEELEVPRDLGDTYAPYLQLQSDQGFDLSRYAGKRVKRYTYEILNYPTGESGVRAHLLLYKNRVVAGEILGPHFLHGLERPE